MPSVTHYYGIIGDGHVRGRAGPAPTTVDPIAGYTLSMAGLTGGTADLNVVVRGASSGAIGRIVRPSDGATAVLELWGLPAFIPGETLNLDNGATATCVTLLQGGLYHGLNQYVLQQQDALLNTGVPADLASDTPWWDRNCQVARNVNIAAGYTGTIAKGDRLTTSGGAQFTILLISAGAAGSIDLKVIRVTGTITPGHTVGFTGGTATIATVQAAQPIGTWVPFHLMPNLSGLGTYFERLPNGNGTDGDQAGIGPEVHIIRRAYDKHLAAADAADRGTRVLPFSTFDDNSNDDALLGGVSVQTVVCTGTFPTNWVTGETVTGPGGWSAVVQGFNAANKRLYVRRVNGATLGAGSVVGSTSGASATTSGPAFGFQPGSKYWLDLIAQITTAQAQPGALWMGSAAKWEGVFLMIWEAELGPFGLCPWPTNAQMIEEWTDFIADLRTTLGNQKLPIALFHMDVRSQQGINIFGIPFAYVLRDVQRQLSVMLDNVVLVSTDGMQGATTGLLPYPSSIVFLRTQDYLELGWRAWRALEFAQYVFPTSDFAPLPLILTAGQSQMVGGIPAAFASIDGDPDLYSTASFPGVSTIDPAVFMWNAQDGVQAWEPFDVLMNGNTFFGMGPGSFSGVVVALALRMKRRFSETAGSAEIGFIHLAVNATSCYAGSLGALATWDPLAGERVQVGGSFTITAIAASGGLPQRGRVTASPGVFSAFVVGQQANLTGSSGFLGAGGNNNTTWTTSTIFAKAGDSSWIELTSGVGNYVNEGPTTFTIRHGPYPLWPLVQNQVRAAFDKCASQLRRVPKPSLIVWWNGESDLQQVPNYQAALTRVLTGLREIFGMRHKGEPEVPVVILQLTRRTPWSVPDADIEALIQAQQNVAAEIGNAVTVSTDKLPLQMASPPVFPRTVRQHNGVHHTPRGFIMAGFMADAAAGGLVGIPAHPDGEAAVDFGADGGLLELGGTDAGGAESVGGQEATVVDAAGEAGTDAPITAQEAASTAAALRAAIANGGDVAAYTLNGRTVQHRSLGELLQALRYFEAQEQRARGLRRTKVRFQ